MDDSNVMHISAQIECARVFDQKLLELRRTVCEPSRLGGGTKARATIEAIKSEAESLLEAVTKMSETLKSDNALRESNMSVMQCWMDECLREIEPLEEEAREAGLLPSSGAEASGIDEKFENGQEQKLQTSDSQENRYHPGRKSNPSRRLFE